MLRGEGGRLVIKELLFDRPRGEYVRQRITRCPADVGLHTVASWLAQRYAEPVYEARSEEPKAGEIRVGGPLAHDRENRLPEIRVQCRLHPASAARHTACDRDIRALADRDGRVAVTKAAAADLVGGV
jgi:hypothetical protein